MFLYRSHYRILRKFLGFLCLVLKTEVGSNGHPWINLWRIGSTLHSYRYLLPPLSQNDRTRNPNPHLYRSLSLALIFLVAIICHLKRHDDTSAAERDCHALSSTTKCPIMTLHSAKLMRTHNSSLYTSWGYPTTPQCRKHSTAASSIGPGIYTVSTSLPVHF